MFILAQVFGIITLILTTICVHFNSKEKILIAQIFANISLGIQYFLLNALTGGCMAIINTTRCLVFYYYKKKDKKPSLAFLILFITIAIIFGIISWQNVYSIIPVLAGIVFTYGLWQENLEVTKVCTLIASCKFIYNYVVRAYASMLQAMIECVSSIIAIFRYKKEKV